MPVQKVRFRRDTLLQFFERAAPAIVGMESCAGSQWIARKIQALGHRVRLIPAQFVKPYVKSNKSDIIDAEAIAEAATRPTMRFAALKSEEQADLQALHRVRDQMIGTRTRLINQMRAFCLEYGIALRQGAGLFKLDLPQVIEDRSNDLSSAMRKLLADLFTDLGQLERRIGDVTREIEAIASREDAARRLMTIRGIGALGQLRSWLPLETADNSRKLAIWQRGLALCHGNTRPEESRSFSASASGGTATCASSSYMEHDHAFGTSTEHEIDWGTGWMAFRLGCTPIKLSLHLPLKWPGSSGSS
ncbi:IS110 family insertion sequence transposase domain-containing protein (plasmid) [Rhizobium sp. NXC24]|nr:IS110 family insertion sequence transposase domain-containing protein [Rhizobium sp. NXC24]